MPNPRFACGDATAEGPMGPLRASRASAGSECDGAAANDEPEGQAGVDPDILRYVLRTYGVVSRILSGQKRAPSRRWGDGQAYDTEQEHQDCTRRIVLVRQSATSEGKSCSLTLLRRLAVSGLDFEFRRQTDVLSINPLQNSLSPIGRGTGRKQTAGREL